MLRTLSTLALATTLGLGLTGAALAESRNYDLKGFDRIDISSGIDANVTVGDSFAISADAAGIDALDNLKLDVSGGVLKASFDQSFLDFIVSGGLVGMLLSNGNAITVNITLPALTGIAASSGADVKAEGLTVDTIQLDASSGSDIKLTQAKFGSVSAASSSGAGIELTGTCDKISVDVSSGAGLNAEDLVCTDARVKASSGADALVHATSALKAEASSGGDITVRGKPPQTDLDSSSGGDISLED